MERETKEAANKGSKTMKTAIIDSMGGDDTTITGTIVALYETEIEARANLDDAAKTPCGSERFFTMTIDDTNEIAEYRREMLGRTPWVAGDKIAW